MYQRTLQAIIEKQLHKGKVIVIYGARQVGKTTLVQAIIGNNPTGALYLDCDLLRNREALEHQDEIKLKQFLGNVTLLVLDEAQRVRDIGLVLKILHTYMPDTQIIATGSSSFELANTINEPLTGRVLDYLLLPLSYEELLSESNPIEIKSEIDSVLRFGSYPDIVHLSETDKDLYLQKLANNYLYKDILEYERIKKPEQLLKILQLLALQIGSEVSFAEIGTQLGLNTVTMQRYIDLLEKTYVIFHLSAFSRNLRKEISKSKKIYFWDLGIRNALIQNFNPLPLRSDAGALWENYCISERLKLNDHHQIVANHFFWRTYDQQEIDLLEEKQGKLNAYECKLNTRAKTTTPRIFLESYPGSSYSIVSQETVSTFLLPSDTSA